MVYLAVGIPLMKLAERGTQGSNINEFVALAL